MREIEFRGKRRDTGEWVYGDLSISKSWSKNTTPEYGICFDKEDINGYLNREWEGVRKETVGQYTGLKDRNGVKIFEGDIILWRHTESTGFFVKKNTVVVFDEGCFSTRMIDNFYPGDLAPNGSSLYAKCEWFDKIMKEFPRGNFFYVVIGNIHDNPELLEKGT
jgi:uncharacterized phage protein (TIGR01671 family)